MNLSRPGPATALLAGVVLAGAVLAGVVLAGCGETADRTEPTATPPGPSTPAATPTPRPLPATTAGVGGMDIRYLDDAGQVKDLRVKDFRP